MKKGFTLIELLAVIVILAIIAIIAVPIVLDIIKDTKESAMLRSADFYLDGVENAIAQSVLKGISITDGTYSIMEDGNICLGALTDNTCTGDILKVEVDGEKPANGSITIGKGTITSAEIVLNDKTIILGSGGQLAITDGYTALSNFEYYLGSEHPTIDLVDGVPVAPITLAENEILITEYKGKSKEVVVSDTYTIDGITYNVVLLSCAYYHYAEYADVDIDLPDYSYSIGTFYEDTNIESVVFTKNIKFIYSYYNYDTFSYETFYIKENSIENLFYNCTNLKKVILPNDIISIDESAFEGSGIISITIPDSVTSIGESAFKGCTSLTSITNPDSVTSIGNHAFWGCTSLTSITIPESVTSIGSYAFTGCTSLTSIVVNQNNSVYDSRNNSNAIIKTVTNELVVGCKSTVIPNSITSIGNYAFYGCSSLTSITIPESVTSIGSYAFSGCTGLTSITIPSSLTSIGYNAFEDCTGLTSIVVNQNNSVYDSRDNSNAIIKTATNELVVGCKSTVIPDSVTSIGHYAFYGCTGLTSITIPSSVTSIGTSAFYGCTGLTSITIPDSVTSIGFIAFSDCTNLKTIHYNGSAYKAPWGAYDATVISSVCKLAENGDIAPTGISVGDKYECEVKSGTKYNFYVLSTNEDGTTNLIMEENIYYDESANTVGIATSSNTKWKVAWYGDSAVNSYGPVTAMTYLHNATKDWNKVPNIVIDYTDEGGHYGTIKTTDTVTKITKKDGNTVTGTYENLKARLPMRKELDDQGCDGSGAASCTTWLSSTDLTSGGVRGYWSLASAPSTNTTSAYRVRWNQASGVSNANDSTWGVRPVISIKLQ